MIDTSSTQLTHRASTITTESLAFIGGLIAEITATMPSPVKMTVTHLIAQFQDHPLLFLALLAFIGAIAKSIVAYLLYLIADKLEDVLIPKYGKFFGITHHEVEKLGKHFSGGYRDFMIIFFARAIPIVPTAPVSIIAGVLKIQLRPYLLAGFIGLFFRNFFYLYLGYAGVSSYGSLVRHVENFETLISITLLLGIIGTLAFIWYSKNKAHFVEKLQEMTLERKKRKKK